MTTKTSRPELERRLRATYRAKAEQLSALDPARAPRWSLPEDDVTTRAVPLRTGRRRSIVGVALVAVAALVGAVAYVSLRGSGGGTHGRRSVQTPVAPAAGAVDAPVLAPTFVPRGLQLWSMQTSATGSQNPYTITQLFGTVGSDGAPAPALLVQVQPNPPGGQVFPGWPTRVNVRGVAAAVVPAKDSGQIGGSATEDLAWVEGDAEVNVMLRGIDADQAAAILNRLQTRGASLLDGFDPATAPAGFDLLGERRASAQTAVQATFGYATGPVVPGAQVDLAVTTITAGAYPDYLQAWMSGTRDSDGSASYLDSAAGLIVVWPDGHESVAGPATINRATLERVAKSATLLDQSAAQKLWDDASSRFAELPLLAATNVTAGRLELRGHGNASTLCLRVASETPVCSQPRLAAGTFAVENLLVGSTLSSGQWIVFMAAATPPTVYDPTSLAPRRGATPLPGQTTTLGGLQVAVVAVPDTVGRVTPTLDPPGNSLAFLGVLSRPHS